MTFAQHSERAESSSAGWLINLLRRSTGDHGDETTVLLTVDEVRSLAELLDEVGVSEALPSHQQLDHRVSVMAKKLWDHLRV